MPNASNGTQNAETGFGSNQLHEQQPKSQVTVANDCGTLQQPNEADTPSVVSNNQENMQQRDIAEMNQKTDLYNSATDELNEPEGEHEIADFKNENIRNIVDDNNKANVMPNNNNNTSPLPNNTDNQNGNEVIGEGTGVVKTPLPAGKVVRRKKTPPQGGGNGNETSNGTTLNNNRTNTMQRMSIAKMEGLANNTSNDYLNITSMSASMEIEGGSNHLIAFALSLLILSHFQTKANMSI